jgi:alkylhydroperoxidase family enzyme
MAARKLEERLDQVKQFRGAAPSESIDAALRKALADRSNLVVAEAAKIVGEQSRAMLIPEMVAALDRLFDDPVKNDSKCWGKTAIVKALVALDYGESSGFLRASRHVQMEPVWGGQEDAAIHWEICDEAALALGNSRFASAVKILTDTWRQARESEFRSVLLRALSVSRQESALQFLLQIVAKGSDRDSAAALDALHLHKDSEEIQKLVEEARRTRAKSRDISYAQNAQICSRGL